MTKDKTKTVKEESQEEIIETPENKTKEYKETKEPKSSKEKSSKSDKKEEKAAKKGKKKEKLDEKAVEIEQLGQKLQEINDKYLRLSAEFDNYRKRTLKEKMELTKFAGEKILVNILPVLDNFERAINAMNQTQDMEATKEGIHLIHKNFCDFVSQNGIKEIEAINQPFDTDIHEAITKIPAPQEELKGKVVDCIEKGYTLNEKVIRFAKVVVGE